MLMRRSKLYLETLCLKSSESISLPLFLINDVMLQEESLQAVKDYLLTNPINHIDGLQQKYTTRLRNTNSKAEIAIMLAALVSLKRTDPRQYPTTDVTRIEHPLVSLHQLLDGCASQWRPLAEYHVLVVRKVAGYCIGLEYITNLLTRLGSLDEIEWHEVMTSLTSVEHYWYVRLQQSMDHRSAMNAAFLFNPDTTGPIYKTSGSRTGRF